MTYKASKLKTFDTYSKYYDLLYSDKDYTAESNYIESLIKRYNPNTTTILELGCGTGKHASLLTQKGFTVFGVDLSETMLAEAKKVGVDCQQGDVRNFRINKKFDTVISLFHVASYQNTDSDICNYFETAATHLQTGDVFIFDLWYKPAVLAQGSESRIKELENEAIKVKRFCTPNHIPEKSIIEVNYEIHITNKKNSETEIIKETHTMRYFSDTEISYFAKKSNIKIIQSEEWLTQKKPSEKTWGVCFMGVRE